MDRVLETLVLQNYEVVFEVNPATDRFRKIISKPDALIQFPEEGPMSQVRDFIATDKICEADRSIFLTETQLGHVLAKMAEESAFRQISPLFRIRTNCITEAFPLSLEKTVPLLYAPSVTRRMKYTGNTKKIWICD